MTKKYNFKEFSSELHNTILYVYIKQSRPKKMLSYDEMYRTLDILYDVQNIHLISINAITSLECEQLIIYNCVKNKIVENNCNLSQDKIKQIEKIIWESIDWLDGRREI